MRSPENLKGEGGEVDSALLEGNLRRPMGANVISPANIIPPIVGISEARMTLMAS
jgi:hypothetical protein